MAIETGGSKNVPAQIKARLSKLMANLDRICTVIGHLLWTLPHVKRLILITFQRVGDLKAANAVGEYSLRSKAPVNLESFPHFNAHLSLVS